MLMNARRVGTSNHNSFLKLFIIEFLKLRFKDRLPVPLCNPGVLGPPGKRFLLNRSPGARCLNIAGCTYELNDWHTDFKSGFQWNPKTFYRDIAYANKEGVDVKIPWELSRFQYLNLLGQAYILTKNKEFANEFSSQIVDWIECNPFGFGVNWSSTMDVAIRAVNWLVSMEYFSEEKIFSQDFSSSP